MRSPRAAVGAAVLVVAVLGAACNGGADDTGSDEATTTTSPTDTTSPGASPTTSTEERPATAPVSVYLLAGEELRVGWVRTVEAPEVADGALRQLLAGPTPDEVALGLSSAVPPGTELLGVEVDEGGIAHVDLSDDFGTGGGSLSMNARLAQVVYTATQFPTVDAVRLLLEGEPATALGGEGLLVDRPLSRADFEFQGEYDDLAPPVLVETPRPGERVERSLRVAGSANTFEAALYLEVLGPAGEVLVPETYVMATSGTGTRGTFDATVELAPGASDATLLAFERSARDGTRTGIVEIPLEVAG